MHDLYAPPLYIITPTPSKHTCSVILGQVLQYLWASVFFGLSLLVYKIDTIYIIKKLDNYVPVPFQLLNSMILRKF